MTKEVRGAGRGRYAANKARHDQRTPFPARPTHEAHTRALREALRKCACPGNPEHYPGARCPADATQEDFLCDHCRTVQCPTRTPAELEDLTTCLRLGCPEHTVD